MSVRTVALAMAATAALLGATVSYASAPRGSRSNPVPVRTTVPIPGSGGWKFRVNRSVLHAPADYLINVTATNTGKGTISAGLVLVVQAVGRSNVAYDLFRDRCRAVPNGFDVLKGVPPGGRISGNICFSVKKTDVRSLLLTVHSGISFKDVLVYFKTH